MKIGLITSSGGHLYQLMRLESWWQNYPHFWLTNKTEDVKDLLKKEKIYYGFFPESRHLFNAARNFFLGLKIIYQEKPQVLVSCGAGIAPPVFLAGKIMGCKLIFIEPYDFIAYPSLSGRILYSFVDLFLVQHKEQKKFYPKARHWGTTL